jgi:hypothetical protein
MVSALTLELFHFPYFETAYWPVPLLFSNSFIILFFGEEMGRPLELYSKNDKD